jgi:DNA-binding beta-propeller fold protein YncE
MSTSRWLLSLCGLLWAVSGSGATLLVGNKSEASVSLIDLASGREVARAETRPGPHEIAVSGDGRTAVVTNYGDREAGNTLSIIDVVRGTTTATIDLGDYTRPHGILFTTDNCRVLVTAEGAGALLQVDVCSAEVLSAMPTGQEVSHMLAFDPTARRAYVANIGSGSISIIDVAAGELVAFHASGDGAEGIALAPDGRHLWVTNRGEDSVSLFDARSGSLQQKIAVEGFPIRAEILPGDESEEGRVLVTSARSGELTVIDPQAVAVERTVNLGLARKGEADGLFADRFGNSSIPIGIEVEPGGKRVWIAHAGADAVQELDTRTWRQLRLFSTGREPDAMAFSPRTVSRAQSGLSMTLP